MNRIIVHAGHGKTGSSLIQSQLAQNVEKLAKMGVAYPQHASFENARSNFVTSGNGDLLLSDDHEIPIANFATLYSNEQLYRQLLERRNIEKLVEKASYMGAKLVIVIYTRDLFDHSFSYWGQQVKRSKQTLDYNKFLRLGKYGWPHSRLETWLDASDRLGFQLKVFNYSRHKSNIFVHFIYNTLGADFDINKLEYDTKVNVNRSLTMAEYEVQRLFNKWLDKPSHPFVSDALVNRLQEIKSEKPKIKRDAYDAIMSDVESTIKKINRRLDSPERIVVEEFDELQKASSFRPNGNFSFNSIQLNCLVEAISKKIMSFDKLSLNASDANNLKDIALKIERQQQPDMQDAHNLMALAYRARPGDDVIKNKLLKYSSLLKKSKRPI